MAFICKIMQLFVSDDETKVVGLFFVVLHIDDIGFS
jgi:hypothetical protein